MLADYIGNDASRTQAPSDVTFSLPEAAQFLRIPVTLVLTLLKIPGFCARYESTGRISETAVRHLYNKLHASIPG